MNRSGRPALAALAALLALVLPQRAGAQSVVVGTPASNISNGSGLTFTVPIVVDASGVTLGALQARLAWRVGALRFVAAGAGQNGPTVFNADTVNGEVRFAYANPIGITGRTTIGNVTFQSLGPPSDTAQLDMLIDDAAEAVSFADITGFTVGTGTLTCVIGGRWGDLDNNDQVMSNDALVILTHAVGLPITPLTPVNGDVDADGDTDTRDALIVLTHVVGLPTGGFRVNQVNSTGCGGSPAASMTLFTVASLAPGDQVPLVATAYDTGGLATHAVPSALSRDTTVVRAVGAQLLAVAAGTTRVVAFVAPGVGDSVTVVVAARHLWHVGLSQASADQGVETGSPAQPYASIQAAVNRAAPGDTVQISSDTYRETVRVTKHLAIRGQGGGTVLAPSSGAAFVVDSLGSGDSVGIEKLSIEDAGIGVDARGSAGALAVVDMAIRRSRGPAVRAHGLDDLLVDSVLIDGAAGAGILADSVDQVTLLQVGIGVITAAGAGASRAVDVRHGTDLFATDLTVTGASLVSVAVDHVHLQRGNYYYGPDGRQIVVDSAQTLLVDTINVINAGDGDPAGFAVDIRMLPGGTATLNNLDLNFVGASGLRVRGGAQLVSQGTDVTLTTLGAVPGRWALWLDSVAQVDMRRGVVQNGRSRIQNCFGCGGTVRLDTVDFLIGGLEARRLDSLLVRQSDLANDVLPLLDVDTVRVVRLDSVAAHHGMLPFVSDTFSIGPFAVDFLAVDTATVDSLWSYHLPGGSVRFDSVANARLTHSKLELHHESPPPAAFRAAVGFRSVPRFRMAQTIVDNRSTVSQYGVLALRGSTGFSIVVDSSSFLGSGYAVLAEGRGTAATDSVVLRSLDVRPGLSAGPGYGVLVDSVSWFSLTSSVVDTVGVTGIGARAFDIGAGQILNSTFRQAQAWLLTRGDSGAAELSGNTIECGTLGQYNGIVRAATATVNNNLVTGPCVAGLLAANGSTKRGPAVMRGNTVTLTALIGNAGISAQGTYRVEMVGNTLTGARILPVSLNATQFVDSARVDSNTAQTFGFSGGLHILANLTNRTTVTARGNLFDHGSGPGVNAQNVRGRFVHNTVRDSTGIGMLFTNTPTDTIVLDSNVIVDRQNTAINVGSNGVVLGSRNFVARNTRGLLGSGSVIVTMNQSVFQQNVQYGVTGTVGNFNVQNNWWGDANGPRCLSLCVGSVVGDSVKGTTNFAPFLTSPPTTPTGVAPIQPVGSVTNLRAGATITRAGASQPWSPAPRRGTGRSALTAPPLPVRPVPQPQPEVIH